MRARMLAVATGIVVATRLPELPAAAPLIAALPLLIPLALSAPAALRGGAWLCAGFLWGILSGHAMLAHALPAALEGRDLALSVCITGLPVARHDARGETWRLRARVLGPGIDAPPGQPTWRGRQLDLSWYGNGHFEPGERWEMRVRLRAPRGFVGPGARDYQAWLHSEAIDATGYVIGKGTPARRSGSCRAGADPWRAQLRARLQRSLGAEPSLGMLLAVTLGDASAFGAADWERFAQTGTTHLMVISGMHIALVAALSCVLGTWLARRARWLLQWLPARCWGVALALPATLAYAALAGWSVSVRRAALMSSALLLSLLLERAPSAWTAFCAALLAVLALEPLAATQPGFWLSFLAVAALLAGFGGRLEGPARVQMLWRPQLVVLVALVAPLALAGQSQAPLAPLVNALAIPLVDIAVVPAALAGCVLLPVSEPLASLPLRLALRGLDALDWLLVHAAALSPPPLAAGAEASPWRIALAALGAAWTLAPRGVRGRALGLVLMLPLLQPARPAPGALELVVLDVGQGSAVIARTARHTLVYDTGPRYSERFEAGRALLVPALRALGSTRVDRLLLSHADNDHAGGAAGLLALMPVDEILAGEAVPVPGARACHRNQRWRWDGVEFAILHPAVPGARGNDASCVLRITVRGTHVLLAGDVEARAEAALLARSREKLAAAVLLVPHHGSRSSSGAAFVDAVRPRLALVSAGHRNSFGHPHPDVVARYRAQGAEVLETARAGAIVIRINADGSLERVRRWRHEARRYWYSGLD